jgi:hypothetical protein
MQTDAKLRTQEEIGEYCERKAKAKKMKILVYGVRVDDQVYYAIDKSSLVHCICIDKDIPITRKRDTYYVDGFEDLHT